MKFSLHLAQYYSNVDLKGLPRDELVSRLGLQLGAIEDVIDYAPKYNDIVVVRVVSCEKHPNADKLSLCRVDDGGVAQNVERGEDGLVQVVCGAPNVHADMWAVWIPPMATVPSTFDTDPFVLEARELRGKVSNGMLASPAELDISDNHDGILEIFPEDEGRDLQAGESVSGLFGLDDVVIDCENKMFTHRPDCFGNLGIAREVAGIFGLAFKSPEWYANPPVFESRNTLPIQVSNEIPELVPRFMAVVMQNVTVGPSPTWMQASLKRVGIKPINNVVDVSNYIMHLTGQPTHAFDYDKLQKYSGTPSLIARKSKAGETITLLGQKKVTLTGEEMVISTDTQAVALAGVMGGADTEVDETTKTIVIECATFDMYSIRRTSMRHGLFTDAVTRYNKGQSPLQNDRVLAYLMKCMNEATGAEQASDVYDIFQGANNQAVQVSKDKIRAVLGADISNKEIETLLSNVEFQVDLSENDEDLCWITAPFWRMDIAIPEDIVEEVGRLYGYDKLPVALPPRGSRPATKNKIREFSNSLRRTLKESGANEVLTYSFVHGELLRHTGTDPEKWAYHLRNAISPDLQYYRTSLMPSLLAKVRPNVKAQAGRDYNEFALFEVGKVHVKDEFEADESSLPKQMRRLALVFAAEGKAVKNYEGSAYYQAKKYLDVITHGQATYLPLDTNEYPVAAPFQKGRTAVVQVNDQILGVVGEFNHRAVSHLKLPVFCAGFEVDVDLLQEHIKADQYQQLSTFPSTNQDVTLEVDEKTSWAHVEELLHAELAVAKAEQGYWYAIEPLDIYQADGSDKKRYSFRIELTHHEKTLKTDEVNNLLEALSKAAHENLGAVRI